MSKLNYSVTPGDGVHIRDLESDLKGTLRDVPMQWRSFVSTIVGEGEMEMYDHLNDRHKFQSVLMSLIMRDEPPFTKQVIQDTLDSLAVDLPELAAKWEKQYMVGLLMY